MGVAVHLKFKTNIQSVLSFTVLLPLPSVSAKLPLVHPLTLTTTLRKSLLVNVPVGVILNVPVSHVVCSIQSSPRVHPVPIVRGVVSEKSVSGRSCVFSSNKFS